MPEQIHKLVLLTLLLAASGFAQAPPRAQAGAGPQAMPKPSAAQPQPSQGQFVPPSQAACVPPACPPPAVVYPPTPEQMAPVAPHVIYKFGQLTISAENSTLSSILSAVRTRTGAQIDMPPDAANDRVAAQLGPGNPRDVLASLLAGSRFDYIVLGSPSDPDALAQVILTPHAGSGGAPPNTQNATASSNTAEMPPRPAGGAGRPEMAGDEDEGAEAQPEPQPAPQPVIAQPMPPTGQVPPGAQPGGQGQQQNPNQVKSPEQLLLELQKMQQQNQQQQQGQQPPRPRGQQQN